MLIKSLALVFLFIQQALAFIPSSDFLLEKATKNSGKGAFYIEQEVLFKSDTETLPVKEMWTVEDADSMKLVIRAGSLSAAFIYSGGKISTLENSSTISSRRISNENIERFLHARSEKTLAQLLLGAKILSADPLRARPRAKTVQQIKYEPDSYVRLVRLDKEPAFLISYSPQTKDLASAPGVWVDQTSYAIKKIRFPSQAEVQSQQITPLSQDLTFPKSRIVTWGQNVVEIRLIKANSLGKPKDLDAQLSTSTLTIPNQWGTSALLNQVKEFYQRFR